MSPGSCVSVLSVLGGGQDGRLETERLVLRPFEPGDAPVVEREVSRVEMARMLAVPHPYPADAASEWIATTKPGRDFAVVLRKDGELIGAVSLVRNEQHRRASLGYWCALSYWGHGYMTEAVRAVIGYGFEVLALNRIHAECHDDNPASRRVLEKAGMTLEGCLRQHSFRLGRVADKLQFGIVRDEWPR
jgi:[ribosomal protein S5]-alanine N-acetyltransferase